MGKQADYFRQQAEAMKAAQQTTFEQGGMSMEEAFEYQRKLGQAQLEQARLQQMAYLQNQARYSQGWTDPLSALANQSSMDRVQKPVPINTFDKEPKGLFPRYRKSKLKSYHWALIVAVLFVFLIILELS